MPLVLFLIPLFEIFGLWGFTSLAATFDNPIVRYLPLALALIAVVWLAAKNTKSLSLQQVAVASLLVSLVFVGCFQIMGLTLSGLAKDIDLVSIENLFRLSIITVIATVCHFVLFAGIRYFRKARKEPLLD